MIKRMITLDEFKDTVYQFVADPAVEEHLLSTVFVPLYSLKNADNRNIAGQHASTPDGECFQPETKHDAAREAMKLYAIPPIMTSFRFTGSMLEGDMGSTFVSSFLATPSPGEMLARRSNASLLPRESMVVGSFRLDTLASIGLPFCVVMYPNLSQVMLPFHTFPSFPTSSDHQQESSAVGEEGQRMVVVVVDIGCAEAVLRGSDVYAPGVITVSRPMMPGDTILLVVQIKKEEVMENEHDTSVVNKKSVPCTSTKAGEEKGEVGNTCENEALPNAGNALNQRKKFQCRTTLIRGERIVLPPYSPVSFPEHKINQDHSQESGENFTRGLASLADQRHIVKEETVAQNPSANAKDQGCFVILGGGTALMDSKGIIANHGKQKGIAVRMEWNVWCQPSQPQIQKMLLSSSFQRKKNEKQEHSKEEAREGEHASAPPFFLQNFSSMIPPWLLVHHLPRSCWALKEVGESQRVHPDRNRSRDEGWKAVQSSTISSTPSSSFAAFPCVLDACAAPGGKSSLLLSLLSARSREVWNEEWASVSKTMEANIGEDSLQSMGFRLVCCERSRSRYAHMKKLLTEHFDSMNTEEHNEWLSTVCLCLCNDMNQLVKEQQECSSSAFCRFTKQHHGEEESSMVTTKGGELDAVLLDPPCSGMGLRPKLLPHPHSLQDINGFADYQRKLFDSAYCLLVYRLSTTSSCKHLVYSTCTITLEENEKNVLHFLRSYPNVRLARAKGKEESCLCELFGVRRLADSTACATDHLSAKLPTSQNPRSRVLLADQILKLQEEKESKSSAEPLASSFASLPPVLLLRIMPALWRTAQSSCVGILEKLGWNGPCAAPIEDGVGFFVALFEVWPLQ